MRPEHLPRPPGTGLCVCGVAYFFQRSDVIGKPGHFVCDRCGRRYRFEGAWTPPSDALQAEPVPYRAPVETGEDWPA